LLLVNAHYGSIPFVLPGEEHLEWELILDTTNEDGFLKQTKKFGSGDDVELGDRAACLLRLAVGAQAQARQESWKRRPVALPEALSGEGEGAGGKKPQAEAVHAPPP